MYMIKIIYKFLHSLRERDNHLNTFEYHFSIRKSQPFSVICCSKYLGKTSKQKKIKKHQKAQTSCYIVDAQPILTVK